MRTVLVFFLAGSLALAGGADPAAQLLKKGEFDKAAEAAQKLVDKDPKNVDAWIVLADALIALKQPEEAWNRLEPAVTENPDSAPLLCKLGDVFVKVAEAAQADPNAGSNVQMHFEDARNMYTKALDKDPKLADAVYGKAYVAYWLSDNEEAKRQLSACLLLNPNHGKAHSLQAFLLYNEKKYPEAEAKYEIARKIDDSDPLTCLRYGHSLFAQGKTDAAKAAYLYALKRHPEYETSITSGLLYLVKKDYSKATDLLLEATKQVPGSAFAWFHLGRCYFANKAYKDAMAAFRKAHDLAPKNAEFLYFLGYTAESEGDAAGALDAYREALKDDPAHENAAFRFEGLIRGAGQFEDQVKLYDELIKLAPENAIVHNNYALILRDWAEQRGASKMDNPPEEVRKGIRRAGEVYEIAARLLPDDPQIQSDTGLLFEFYPCNRNDEKALQYFTKSLEASEFSYRDAFDGLNRLCRRTSRWDVLRKYAEQVADAMDSGKDAIVPLNAGEPQPVPAETPGLKARAEAAVRDAEAKLKG